MPEVIFTGPAGRLEGRYHPAKQKNAPIAMILHPHPQFGGTMNHQIVYQCYYAFVHRGFSVLRFNFRGVGRSQGSFDHGTGELSDAASALDWAQTINPEARACWIAGFSFGAWIGMQLLMRRPEIEGFISIAPPANLYDFSFLAPCPSSGLIVHGDKDAVVPAKDVNTLVEKLKTQKGIVIEQQVIPGANHFFDGKVEPLMEIGDRLSRHAARQRSLRACDDGVRRPAARRQCRRHRQAADERLEGDVRGAGTFRRPHLHRQRQCRVRMSQIRDPPIKAALEAQLAAYAGKPIGVLVRSAAEMAQVLSDNPFPKAAPSRTMAAVPRRAAAGGRAGWRSRPSVTKRSGSDAARSTFTTATAWRSRNWSYQPPRTAPRAT